jgi:hypothetical protein
MSTRLCAASELTPMWPFQLSGKNITAFLVSITVGLYSGWDNAQIKTLLDLMFSQRCPWRVPYVMSYSLLWLLGCLFSRGDGSRTFLRNVVNFCQITQCPSQNSTLFRCNTCRRVSSCVKIVHVTSATGSSRTATSKWDCATNGLCSANGAFPRPSSTDLGQGSREVARSDSPPLQRNCPQNLEHYDLGGTLRALST